MTTLIPGLCKQSLLGLSGRQGCGGSLDSMWVSFQPRVTSWDGQEGHASSSFRVNLFPWRKPSHEWLSFLHPHPNPACLIPRLFMNVLTHHLVHIHKLPLLPYWFAVPAVPQAVSKGRAHVSVPPPSPSQRLKWGLEKPWLKERAWIEHLRDSVHLRENWW